MNTTRVHNTNMKPQETNKAKMLKVIPEEKQKLVGEKDADNIS